LSCLPTSWKGEVMGLGADAEDDLLEARALPVERERPVEAERYLARLANVWRLIL